MQLSEGVVGDQAQEEVCLSVPRASLLIINSYFSYGLKIISCDLRVTNRRPPSGFDGYSVHSVYIYTRGKSVHWHKYFRFLPQRPYKNLRALGVPASRTFLSKFAPGKKSST